MFTKSRVNTTPHRGLNPRISRDRGATWRHSALQDGKRSRGPAPGRGPYLPPVYLPSPYSLRPILKRAGVFRFPGLPAIFSGGVSHVSELREKSTARGFADAGGVSRGIACLLRRTTGCGPIGGLVQAKTKARGLFHPRFRWLQMLPSQPGHGRCRQGSMFLPAVDLPIICRPTS